MSEQGLVEVFINFHINKTLLFDKFFHETIFHIFITKIGGISVETKTKLKSSLEILTKKHVKST